MDYETRQFISQSEANRDEKLHLASAMTIVAVITGLLAAVNSVILFIVNGYLLNYIALTFAILNVLLVFLMIYSFIWNNSQKVYLSNTEDDWGEETDNFAGRITFCLCIIFGVLEMVSLVVYILAQSSILGYYTSSEQGANIDRFEKVLTVTLPFIVILTILIIALIIYQIHGYYQLTISHSTSRFHIFTLSIIAALNTWAVIYILQGLDINFLAVIINFIVLGVIVIAVISNIWKLKGIFIVLASAQVLLIPVMLGFQGQFIRDYQNLEIYNMQNCQNMMNRVPKDHIESNHCYSKYIMEDCGTEKCYSNSCEKAAMVQMWDIKDNSTKLGCLNRNCCSQTSNLFTKDYIYLVGFSLAETLFLFTLILFEFHLSRMVRGEKTLGRNLEMLFVILFLATCIFGVLLLAQHYDQVPLRQDPQFAETNLVQKASKFTTTEKYVCKTLTELLTSRVIISSSCQSQAGCPINKQADNIKKEQYVLFGIWGKGIDKFVRKEETIYENVANSKFLFENYDGDNKDFFSVLGQHNEIQDYVDDLQLCYEIGQKELQVHLYQNIAEFAIGSETKQQEIGKHFMKRQHNTDTKPQTSNNSCQVPNCSDCKVKICNECKEGFVKSDQSLGCVFSGNFNKNIEIQIPLYKSIKTKVSGFVYGKYKKLGVGDCRYESKDYDTCRDRTVQVPLSNVDVIWDGKGEPIKAKTDTKGAFNFELTSFDIADFSQAPYQPTGGRLSISTHGFQSYSVYQMVDFSEEFYLGTIVLSSNVAIPKDEEKESTKSIRHTSIDDETQKIQFITNNSNSCQAEEYLDGLKKCQKKLCKSDQKNCLFCDDQNNCLSCENQYQLIQNKDKKLNVCQPLNLCDKVQSENNCVKCESTNKCVECNAFSKLDSSKGTCINEYKSCITTIENCLLCNKDNICAICDPGFKLEKGLCKNVDFTSAFDINYYQSTITVYDAQDQSPIENAKIKLVFGQCKSDDYYGTGHTDQNGQYTFQKLIKHYQYSVLISHSQYIDNCYEFRSESQLQVPLSGPLKQGQSRIVLEWDDDKVHPDLFIQFYPVKDKSCLVGFFNKDCTGAHFGQIVDEKIKFQSIFIENLAQVKYLIFVQNFEDKKLYSNSYKERLIESQARIKYYIHGSDKPVVTYVAPTDQQDPKIGTNDAYKSEWLAWLVGCIDGNKAEIPHNIVSQNGLWWTNSLFKWYDTIQQKGDENFPNVNICNIEVD